MGADFCIPIRVGEARVSSNHKAPLAAFVVVALACVVVLATNSMRSYAHDAWRQFAAPVVTGLTLVPSLGGDSATSPSVRDAAADTTADTAPDTSVDAHSSTDATPAVAVTKAKPAAHHRHPHPAKTTPASDPTPAAPQPPATAATQTWPVGATSHSNHPSATAHQPAWTGSTRPAADRGHRFGHHEQSTGSQHHPGTRGWQDRTPGRGMHPAADSRYAGGHGWSSGSHRR
jgi:hypothetical protein